MPAGRKRPGGGMSAATEVIDRVRISEIWSALGGGPLRHGRGQAFWRDGDGLNVSLDDQKGVWHDFVCGEGGGVLDLVQHVRGGSRAEALRFVADVAGVTLESKPLSKGDRREYAVHRRQAGSLAKACAWWVRAMIQELEGMKAQANEDGDIHTLAWSSRELYSMQRAVPSALMGRFVKAVREDPEVTARLVEAGREDEDNAYMVTALIVAMLAKATGNKTEAAHAA
jgi:hypothetical protein